MLTKPEVWSPRDGGQIAKANGFGQWHVPTIGVNLPARKRCVTSSARLQSR
jgi:hypothetical protein